MYEKLNNILILLCRTISTRKLYFSDHPKVTVFAVDLLRQLKEFCLETQTDKLFIGIIDGNLVFEGRNLVGPSIVGKQFINFAGKLHCGGFSFGKATTIEEFKALLSLTVELRQPLTNLKEARELLQSRHIINIELAQHYIDPSGPISRTQKLIWQGQESGNILQSPTLIYQALFDAVAQAHGDVASGNDIDMDATRTVSEYMLHFIRSRFSDMMQRINYPDYDSYTLGHSVRVAALAVYLAHTFKWSDKALLSLATAGLLHDIGKSKIPEEILYKPGRLSKEEFAKMMTHSQVGAEILMGQKNVTPIDIAAAWGHHIRNDNSGYPNQPAWAVRHPITSLLQICDAFEALTATRPYKPALSPHMAFNIMLQDRGGFHPALLATFIATIGLYPPGNFVRLSDGSIGSVIAVGPAIDRPKVLITHDMSGAKIPIKDQFSIHLAAKEHKDLIVEELLMNGPQTFDE